jgi:hypothetical protein
LSALIASLIDSRICVRTVASSIARPATTSVRRSSPSPIDSSDSVSGTESVTFETVSIAVSTSSIRSW